jgi:hypothetical protein
MTARPACSIDFRRWHGSPDRQPIILAYFLLNRLANWQVDSECRYG